MAETLLSSYNLFIDSASGQSTADAGDNFTINLQDSGVTAGDGQFIRMTLDNFSMAKNFPDVHESNSTFLVRGISNGAAFANEPIKTELTFQNCDNLNELATDFGNTLMAVLEAENPAGHAFELSDVVPPATGASNRIISFKLTNKDGGANPAPHLITGLVVQFTDKYDTYALLGGDRVSETDATTSSVTVTINTNDIVVTCKYPAQLSTIPYVFIRAPNVVNANIESKALSADLASVSETGHTVHSDILGRSVVDKYWVQYTAQTGREFFLDINQKNLTHLRLRLTDARNRDLPRYTNQATTGNLEFTAVIRFDVIQKLQHNEFRTQRIEPPIPARFSHGVVKQFNDGRNQFGRDPGY